MSVDEQGLVPPSGGKPEKKPVRFKMGVALLVLWLVMWFAALFVPLLPLGLTAKGTIVAVDLIVAEVIGLLGIVLVGKEAYQAMKSRLLRRRKGK